MGKIGTTWVLGIIQGLVLSAGLAYSLMAPLQITFWEPFPAGSLALGILGVLVWAWFLVENRRDNNQKPHQVLTLITLALPLLIGLALGTFVMTIVA